MKRIAFLSLLLIPSAAAAQNGDQVHSTPYPNGQSAIGTSIEQGVAQYDQASAFGNHHCDSGCGSAYASSLNACCGQSGGWFGDIGFYVLRPQWSGGNPGFAVQSDLGGHVSRQQFDFDHDYNFAPLVSIGYAGPNGLGFRGRWWTLRSREGMDANLAGTPDDTFGLTTPSLLGTGGNVTVGEDQEAAGSFRNRLAMDVIDLERTWSQHFGRSALLLSSGIRYAHVGQTYDADVAFSDIAVPANDFDGAFRFNNTFNGVGPTAALQAFRQIGNTNLSVYGLSRGSVLFGERRQRAFSVVDGVDDQVSLTHNSVLPVMEIEAGTNWTRNMGAYDFFAEGGFVGMVWFNAGNAANSDAIVADVFNTVGTDNVNQNLGLVGLRFSTGVRF